MLACSHPPVGQASWTLELFGDWLVALDVDGHGPVPFKKTRIKPWLKQIWCLPLKANADVVYAMEDGLSVYH